MGTGDRVGVSTEINSNWFKEILVSWPIISKSIIYNFMIKASHKIMVYHRFKYCGLITYYSSS
jgi:hypothetical protein